MKKILAYNILATLVFPLLTCCLLPACKKVDEQATMVAAQPWLATRYAQQSGSHLAPLSWEYPANLQVGDTAILIGKLFPHQPGTVIKVGNVPIQILDTALLTDGWRDQINRLDAVKFVITKEMGIGNNRPVTVTANGTTISGAPINIRFISEGVNRTDTTLLAEQLASWMPDNVNDYAALGYDLVRSVHTNKNGDIYFDNQFSLQTVIQGKTSTILKSGQLLHDDQGTVFTIKSVLGSAVSFEGDMVYFSLEVTEENAESTDNYITRLCSMQLPAGTIHTINRTLVAKGRTATDENGSPYQGNISNLKVVAMNLSTDVNNNLYYSNYYAPGRSYEDHSSWYSNGVKNGVHYQEPAFQSLALVCRMDPTGKVRSIFGTNFNYPTGAFSVFTALYLADPSGKYLYGFTTTNFLHYDMIQYDVLNDDKTGVFNKSEEYYHYYAFEKNPAFQLSGQAYFVGDPFDYKLNPFIQLSNGRILAVTNNSLACIDLTAKTIYCYAGTEAGLAAAPAEQKELTGPAKWVDFYNASLIGQDKTGAVYYCNGFNDYANGVTFYKLYPKK